MKVKLALAFAVLLFASIARADSIPTVSGVVDIPDGSLITSVVTNPNIEDGQSIVSFTFADGTGTETAEGVYAEWGSITFTTPVANLSFVWNGGPYEGGADYDFQVGDNVGDNSVFTSVLTGTAAFAGPGITSLSWGAPSNMSPTGISSMIYTLDSPETPSVPEPSSLLLSAVGLAALIGLTLQRGTRTRHNRFLRS
jgi:hypothetical protein